MVDNLDQAAVYNHTASSQTKEHSAEEQKVNLVDLPAEEVIGLFDKMEAQLARAMLSIPATKGFEIGSGFSGTRLTGSKHNDPFILRGDRLGTLTNHSGGVQGGISNGEEIYFRVAFKPVSTLMKDQWSVTKGGKKQKIKGKGRHDPCVVPRAVPIVEAMAALVLADYYLLNKISKH